MFGKNLWIEPKVLVKILTVETVAIYFVDPVKLQTRLGLENGHLRSCLGCESAPIHEK